MAQNSDADIIYGPRCRLHDLTREFDGWTLPSVTPIHMKSGVCHAPAHAIWMRLPVGCFIPTPDNMDIEVTPVVFNHPTPRKFLTQYEGWTGPFFVRDDGVIEMHQPRGRLFADHMQSVSRGESTRCS